jgi:hypothetical protein
MIKIDTSGFIPRRSGTYFLGIIPGIVFEALVALGDPAFAHNLINRVTQVYPFHGYALLLIFLASCLIVGQTFYYAAWFVDWAVGSMYRFIRYFVFSLTLGSNWLYKAIGRWQGMPPKPFFRHVWRPVRWAREKKIPFNLRPIMTCQRRAALPLLTRKYGVNVPKYPSVQADDEWQTWMLVLGKMPQGLREFFLMTRVTMACGLAELGASDICPTLHNRYFAVVCGVFLLMGFTQTVSSVRRRFEPTRANIMTLAIVMEELKDISLPPQAKKTRAEGGPTLTLSPSEEEEHGDSSE